MKIIRIEWTIDTNIRCGSIVSHHRFLIEMEEELKRSKRERVREKKREYVKDEDWDKKGCIYSICAHVSFDWSSFDMCISFAIYSSTDISYGFFFFFLTTATKLFSLITGVSLIGAKRKNERWFKWSNRDGHWENVLNQSQLGWWR